MKKSALTLAGIVSFASVFAQVSCPTNLDFEVGDLSYWNFYIGQCCPINTPTSTSAVFDRHTLQSSSSSPTTDYYGGFPVVAPGGGNYSLRIGNSSTNAQAERARYYIRVPNNVNNYSLIYKYAVVLEDPQHTPSQQPRFEVKAYDSATNAPISCAMHTYVASSNLPGFSQSPINSNVWYKSWTTSSLNLSGMAGRTIAVDFASGDCDLGGHFGYGYVDMGCGLFAIQNVNCNGAPNTTLNAPPGFMAYTWMDSTYTTTIDTGQSITITTPSTSTQYHVILTPFTGFGCADTLHTTVSVSNIALKAPNDTFNCQAGGITLSPSVTSASNPVTYAWSPANGLSCTSCASPVASPSSTTTYYVTVTDPSGCSKTDSVNISAGPDVNIMAQNLSCFGSNNGSAALTVNGRYPPYSYSWNTVPAQNTQSITGLPAGIYTVIVTDSVNCSNTDTVTITQPPLLTLTSGVIQHVTCFGGINGSAQATAAGGVPPYSFSWNTTPTQNTASAIGLSAGTYTVTVTDANNCIQSSQVTINEPSEIDLVANVKRNSCKWDPNGIAYAVATNGFAPYQYSWSTFPAQNSDTARNLSAGTYTVTVTDIKGCSTAKSVVIDTYPTGQIDAGSDQTICLGKSAQLKVNGSTQSVWWPAVTLDCSNCPAPKATPAVTTVYGVSGIDINQCRDTDYVSVQVIQYNPTQIGEDHKICDGDTVQLFASGGDRYSWSPSESLDRSTISSPKAFPHQHTRYQVIVSQSDCFTDTLYQNIQVFEKPTLTLPPDFRALPGTTVDIIADAQKSDNITWTPSTGLSCDNCYAPTATFSNTITYTATAANAAGCVASDDITITVLCDGSAFYMPNTFTPNADGENDFLFPQGKGINMINRFMIYNRWGEIVYQAANFPANDFRFGWNGTFNNVPLKPDVFVYVVEAVCSSGERAVVRGDVALIR